MKVIPHRQMNLKLEISIEETRMLSLLLNIPNSDSTCETSDFTKDIQKKSHEVLDLTQNNIFSPEHGIKIIRCIDTLIDLMNMSVKFCSKNENKEIVNSNEKIAKQKYFNTKKKKS